MCSRPNTVIRTIILLWNPCGAKKYPLIRKSPSHCITERLVSLPLIRVCTKSRIVVFQQRTDYQCEKNMDFRLIFTLSLPYPKGGEKEGMKKEENKT